MTFDANARIVADACRNFVYNDLADIQSKVSVLYNRSRFSDASSDVEFLISRDFWASRLDAGGDRQDIVETVRVPTACLEDQICAHRATAMICDIEGGEVELLIGADLTGIRLIIVAVHGWAVGGDAINSLMRQLIMSGFNVDLQYSGNGVAVLHA